MSTGVARGKRSARFSARSGTRTCTRRNESSQAAFEYGPYAVLSIAVIALELAVIIIFTIIRGSVWGWPAGLLEAMVVASLWWALVRSRTQKSQFAV
jgi:hypothetical protein